MKYSADLAGPSAMVWTRQWGYQRLSAGRGAPGRPRVLVWLWDWRQHHGQVDGGHRWPQPPHHHHRQRQPWRPAMNVKRWCCGTRTDVRRSLTIWIGDETGVGERGGCVFLSLSVTVLSWFASVERRVVSCNLELCCGAHSVVLCILRFEEDFFLSSAFYFVLSSISLHISFSRDDSFVYFCGLLDLNCISFFSSPFFVAVFFFFRAFSFFFGYLSSSFSLFDLVLFFFFYVLFLLFYTDLLSRGYAGECNKTTTIVEGIRLWRSFGNVGTTCADRHRKQQQQQ